ncbi:MAG: hypothetical protein HDR95_05120 [Bacteroides sp.]|nr:hypothetical protein [Bacteroides sp.]
MITSRDIDKYEAVYPLLVSITKSMTALSTKKPSDIISEFKLDQINKILKQCNSLLGDKRPDVDFEGFDNDTMPQNSDVVVMLELYIASMDKFKISNSDFIGEDWNENLPHYEWKKTK